MIEYNCSISLGALTQPEDVGFEARSRALFYGRNDWPRRGSTEGARDAGLSIGLDVKLKVTAARNADAKLHTVGSASRPVLRDA